MKNLLKAISYIGLILTLFPSFLVFSGAIDIDTNKNLMLIGTILWFITAAMWQKKPKTEEAAD